MAITVDDATAVRLYRKHMRAIGVDVFLGLVILAGFGVIATTTPEMAELLRRLNWVNLAINVLFVLGVVFALARMVVVISMFRQLCRLSDDDLAKMRVYAAWRTGQVCGRVRRLKRFRWP